MVIVVLNPGIVQLMRALSALMLVCVMYVCMHVVHVLRAVCNTYTYHHVQ